MQAWRLTRAAYIALNGEGARLFGGRWNTPGTAMVYAAVDAALGILEVRVHLDLPPALLPDDYVLCCLNLTGVTIEVLDTMPANPRGFGDDWLASLRSPALRVPSAIVPESFNLLLNPAHEKTRGVRLLFVRAFGFDTRLWLGG